jgi:hypothetical protein
MTSDDREMTIRRLRTGSVFRIVAAGTFFSLVPLCVLMGVLSLFGMSTVQWNNQPVVGVKGLLLSPLIGLIMAATFTAIGGAGLSLGLWLYSKVKPFRIQMLVDGAESSSNVS